MKKIKLIFLFCLIAPLASDCQTLWATADYQTKDQVRFRNLVDSAHTSYGEAMYYFYDEGGDKIIVTGHEFWRKIIIGVRTKQFFIDSCKRSGIQFGLYTMMLEIDSPSLLPGDVDPSLYARSMDRDSITHYPFDPRLKLCRDSLFCFKKYPAPDTLGQTWINVRHLPENDVPEFCQRLGLKKTFPVGVAIYQLKIDTIVLPINFFHLYFREPGTKIRYQEPCMFKNVVNFEKSTINIDGGKGQYVYYDNLGFSRVISHVTYEQYKINGVRELKEVYAEWKKNH
jgi:hypothetical protein